MGSCEISTNAAYIPFPAHGLGDHSLSWAKVYAYSILVSALRLSGKPWVVWPCTGTAQPSAMDSERPTHGQLGLRLCIASSFLMSNPTEHHCFSCWLWSLPPQLSENAALGLYSSSLHSNMQTVPKRELVITGITLLSFFWLLVLCTQLFRDNFQMAKFKN